MAGIKAERISNTTSDKIRYQTRMGNTTQTKLHWAVIGEDWNQVLQRVSKRPHEALVTNSCGDLPLHLACYGGQAPPRIIRALIDAYPGSLRVNNKTGRGPLELALINYRAGSRNRAGVLALLRWYQPAEYMNDQFDNEASIDDSESRPLMTNDNIFSEHPPPQMYYTSPQCVVCLEAPAIIALIPCGHVCLCMTCVQITVMKNGLCPIDRCEVNGLYEISEVDLMNSGLQRSGRGIMAAT